MRPSTAKWFAPRSAACASSISRTHLGRRRGGRRLGRWHRRRPDGRGGRGGGGPGQRADADIARNAALVPVGGRGPSASWAPADRPGTRCGRDSASAHLEHARADAARAAHARPIPRPSGSAPAAFTSGGRAPAAAMRRRQRGLCLVPTEVPDDETAVGVTQGGVHHARVQARSTARTARAARSGADRIDGRGLGRRVPASWERIPAGEDARDAHRSPARLWSAGSGPQGIVVGLRPRSGNPSCSRRPRRVTEGIAAAQGHAAHAQLSRSRACTGGCEERAARLPIAFPEPRSVCTRDARMDVRARAASGGIAYAARVTRVTADGRCGRD